MNIERYTPNIKIGLTHNQVLKRKEQNLINYDTSLPTKSIKQILTENFITLFNILNLILGIAVFCVGSYKNMLFLLVMIINTTISTIQEIHSKRIIDNLSITSSSKSTVIRDGKEEKISIYDIVLDDIIIFEPGNQIPTDSILLEGEIEVNESFITGESDSIYKKTGDVLLSGSFVVSGKCIAQVNHIAEENYISQISSGAKYVKKVNSEIMNSLNKIVKILSIAIIPIGILLFFRQLFAEDSSFQIAVVKTVAAIIGMIPEGLVLLTSTVLAVSVIRLSRLKVLVQELYCIETLARVNTLCLDKTGTLTEGSLEVKDYIPIPEKNINSIDIPKIMFNISKFSIDTNPTMEAIKKKFLNINGDLLKLTKHIPFSSKTKWSGFSFEKEGTFILGAPELILKSNFSDYKNFIYKYSNDYRVLLLAHSIYEFEDKNLPKEIRPIAIILLTDKIRNSANKTLRYFKDQGVEIKIISGDNPITVSKIAKQVGVENYSNYIDLSSIEDELEVKKLATNYSIFGRVSPIQKKWIVEALQENGKTVAMTGDGVNDVLSLKTADCSIAMANGSDASKNVSQIVLLNSDFSSMPKIVSEGRRTINNIERSASLFLVKTIYSSFFAIFFLILGETYPFEPIQLSLISIIAIGIPSFVLALEPNNERIQGNFLKNVISKAFPTALSVIVSVVLLALLHKVNYISDSAYSTLCVIATGICGILLLLTLCKSRKSEHKKLPFSKFRLTLALLMIILFIFGLTVLNWWFSIVPLFPLRSSIIKLTVFCTFSFFIFNKCINNLYK